MPALKSIFALAFVLLGNCGFWIFWFNRVTAFGLNRRLTKRLEKAFVGASLLIPGIVLLVDHVAIFDWLQSNAWWPSRGIILPYWAAWALATNIVLGPLWLYSRRWLWPPPHQIAVVESVYDIEAEIQGRCTGDAETAAFAKLPGNQITQIAVAHKVLKLPRRIEAAEGLTIGHITDLHFTGQFNRQHYEFVLRKVMDAAPDLIVVTGDIIDKDECVEWIPEVLGGLTAPHGVYFVLGNHDKRVSDVSLVIQKLRAVGFHDVGAEPANLEIDALSVQIIGNELPWFSRQDASVELKKHDASHEEPSTQFRIGLSHSPDQIKWARREQCDLLFAGHTHGGHARFPLIGPILSPSLYGSSFASGVFYFAPTLMHVARGVAGTHALRWWCTPEVAIVKLTNADEASR